MYGQTQGEMHCAKFEALLAEAIDGALPEPVLQGFQAHAAACSNCGPMLASARAGLRWIKGLEEVEPPRNLVRNILIATSGAEAEAPIQPTFPGMPWRERLRGWMRPVLAPVLVPVVGTIRQPRVALAFGMAFFSITMLLNAAGLRITDLRHVDLRPSAIQASAVRGYYETSAKVVKYYENIRIVYELESRVRDLRNATKPEEKPRPAKEKQRNYKDDNTSGQPDPRRENYSRQESPVTLASLAGPAQHDPSTHNRRVA